MNYFDNVILLSCVRRFEQRVSWQITNTLKSRHWDILKFDYHSSATTFRGNCKPEWNNFYIWGKRKNWSLKCLKLWMIRLRSTWKTTVMIRFSAPLGTLRMGAYSKQGAYFFFEKQLNVQDKTIIQYLLKKETVTKTWTVTYHFTVNVQSTWVDRILFVWRAHGLLNSLEPFFSYYVLIHCIRSNERT